MIVGFSEFVVTSLGPVLMLVSFVLVLVTFLAPTTLLHHSVSLLTITSVNQTQASVGPSLFLGALGSCGRYANTTNIVCTNFSLSPTYSALDGFPPNCIFLLPTLTDTSALQNQSSTASTILSQPPATAPDFILLSLLLSLLFFVGYTGQCVYLTKKKDIWGPFRNRYVATCGVLGFFMGIIPFIVMRMWFAEMLTDFNALEGAQVGDVKHRNGPALIAAARNAFTMAWIAYAFYLVPLVVLFSKISKDAHTVRVQQHDELTYVHASQNNPNSRNPRYNVDAVTTHRDLNYDVER